MYLKQNATLKLFNFKDNYDFKVHVQEIKFQLEKKYLQKILANIKLYYLVFKTFMYFSGDSEHSQNETYQF